MLRSEERILIERAASGDRVAAGQLVRAHQESVYAYILRLSGRSDVAEDVVQEAFVRVFTHLDRFDPRFRFSTWLFTIARRLYVNACQKHRPVYDSDAVGRAPTITREHSERGDAVDTEVRANAREALAVALEELTDEQREALILFHQHDWPIALIAEHMGMPEGTIKSHLHRARRKMRLALEAAPDRHANVEEVWT
jgi:RNA polymerase sigma-70 factor (ECF subfamily)